MEFEIQSYLFGNFVANFFAMEFSLRHFQMLAKSGISSRIGSVVPNL
jgi:hypothetical protein